MIFKHHRSQIPDLRHKSKTTMSSEDPKKNENEETVKNFGGKNKRQDEKRRSCVPCVSHSNNEQDKRLLKRKEKRGMKPRSKRNRKRARSELHAIEEQNYQINVKRLEIDGKPVGDTWLRTVEPYPHSFSTFAKARWVGRTILDVYSTEFGSYPKVRRLPKTESF